MSNHNYLIPKKRFNNQNYIERRVSVAQPKARGSLRTTLTFLYLTDGPANLPRDRLKASIPFLEYAERVLVRWLYTRTNGSERRNYGAAALDAAKSQRYRCEDCGRGDVRILQLHHVKKNGGFSCLCANCHMIKSREQSEVINTPIH
jgi:hypothetical protein